MNFLDVLRQMAIEMAKKHKEKLDREAAEDRGETELGKDGGMGRGKLEDSITYADTQELAEEWQNDGCPNCKAIIPGELSGNESIDFYRGFLLATSAMLGAAISDGIAESFKSFHFYREANGYVASLIVKKTVDQKYQKLEKELEDGRK